MATKDKTKNKAESPDNDLPEGFTTLGRSNVDGWFAREEGNSVQGILKDSFVVKGRKVKGKIFPDKRVYVIEITKGQTNAMNAEGEPTVFAEGETIGVDETGYLKKLDGVEKGREVFLKCKGKEDPSDQQSPWIFAVGVSGAP